jgi:hypothetical protein
VAVTWPLALRPATITLPNGDVYGNTWAMAWVAHQARADPLHLFDSNIYHPHRRSLAFAESLLPQAALGAPVRMLGGSPLLAHNLVLLLTFPLSGLGAFLLARELSRSVPGAFLAGLAFTTCAYRFHHLVHVQSLSIQWLPFALLFLVRSMREGRRRDLAGLVLFSLLQALSSGYYAVLTAAALGLALAGGARAAWRRRTLAPTLAALVAAGAVAGAAYLPYRALRKDQERLTDRTLSRDLPAQRRWSAGWSSYLDPGIYVASPHLLLLARRFASPEPLYAGALVLVLAGTGLAWGRSRRDVALAGLLALAGVLFSLGPEVSLGELSLPGPWRLVRALPGGALLRTPGRFGILAVLAADLLAAFGWAAVTGRLRFRLARPLTALAAVLIVVEAFPVGLAGQLRPPEPAPWTAEWLARAPRAPVLELPWDEETQGRGAVYIYWSTRHWQPMVNGWGGFEPHGNLALGRVGRRWPSAPAAGEMRRWGVRYVVVHTADVPPAQRARLLTSELPRGVYLVAALEDDRIYALDP